MAREFLRFRRELFAVESADHVFTARAGQNPFFVVGLAIDGQFKKVRAFEEALGLTRDLPVLEIRGGEEMNGVPRGFPAVFVFIKADVKRHDPALRRFVPDDFRIAIAARDLLHNGVAGVLCEAAPTVRAVGKALHGGVPSRRVNEDHGRFAILSETAGVVPIDYRRTAEHRAEFVRIERFIEFFPLQKIAAHGVAPVHVAPFAAIRIVLKE